MVSNIDKVRNRKNNDALLIDNINYGRVIAMQTYNNSFKSTIKELIRLFILDYKIEIKGESTANICFLYSLKNNKRVDYDEIVKLFSKSINNVKYINLIQHKSIEKSFKKAYFILKNFVNFKKNKVDDSFISSIVTTKYMMLNENFKKYNLFKDTSVLFTFCDSYPPDNLATQICNNDLIPTITLQHGQYRILSKGNEVADAEVYENFISRYMLTWGQATIDEFNKVGIETKRLKKVGALKSFSFKEKIMDRKTLNTFGIVLSGEYYSTSNIEMIELANLISEKYNMKYYLRLHPRNNRSFYIKHCDSRYLKDILINIENEKYAEKVDFSLLHMTGVFVELLSINSPIIMYKDSLLEPIFKIEPFCVKDIKSFEYVYNLLYEKNEWFKKEQYSKFKYFNEKGNVLENYKIAVESIIMETSKIKDGDK